MEQSSTAQTLSTRIACPLCGEQRLTIFQDHCFRGQWYSCLGCHFAGDGVELLSRVWQLSLEATTVKLASQGCLLGGDDPLPVARLSYEDHCLAPRRLRHQLWQRSQGREAFQRRGREINRLLGLRWDETTSWFESGPLQLFGATTKGAVEGAFAPNATVGGSNRGRHRLFCGHGWKDVLLLPYYDVPGRIATYLVVGRDGDPDKDVVLANVLRYWTPCTQFDAGLAFHPQLLQSRPGTLIGTDDWQLYLQLQAKHYLTDSAPLPLVAWLGSPKHRTRQAWQMFAGRRIVLWAPQLTAAVLRQAIQIDGQLSHAGPTSQHSEALRCWLYEFSPPELMTRIAQRALPWPERVDQEVARMEDHQVEELFLCLGLTPTQLHYVLSRCSHATRTRVLGALHFSAPVATVSIGRTQIEERDGCWFACYRDGADELIADAIVRIDQAMYHAAEQQVVYAGRILYQGEEIAFCERQHALERQGLRWLKEVLLRERKGVLRYSPAWETKLAPIACLFQQPILQQGIERIGWDPEQTAFQLPHYTLETTGRVVPRPALPALVDPPALDLPLPGPLPLEVLSALTADTPSNALFWASWCLLVSNILAPAFGRPTRGIVVSGSGAAAAMTAAAYTCGCRLPHVGPRQWSPMNLPNYRRGEQLHRWPYVIPLDGRLPSRTTRHWLEGDGPRNTVVRGSEEQLLALQLRGDWHTLLDHREFTLADEHLAALPAVLPAYLQHCLARQLALPLAAPELVADVSRDVGQWLTSLQLASTPVKRAQSLLRPAAADGYGEAAGRLISKLLLAGQLTMEAKGRSLGRILWEHKNPDGLFVPKAALAQALERVDAPALDPLRLSQQLDTTRVLRGELEVQGAAGWVIDLVWWKRLHSAETTQRDRLLKLHTGT